MSLPDAQRFVNGDGSPDISCIAELCCPGSPYLDKNGEMTYSRPIKRNRLPDLAGGAIRPVPLGADNPSDE